MIDDAGEITLNYTGAHIKSVNIADYDKFVSNSRYNTSFSSFPIDEFNYLFTSRPLNENENNCWSTSLAHSLGDYGLLGYTVRAIEDDNI